MAGHPRDGHWLHVFGNQPGQAFAQRHAQNANALGAQADGGGQHQVGAIGLEQVDRAHVGVEAPGNQRHHVHQRLGRLAAFLREVGNLIQREDVAGRARAGFLAHVQGVSHKRKVDTKRRQSGSRTWGIETVYRRKADVAHMQARL